MRKFICAVTLCCALYFGSGCMDSSRYHQPQDKQWLTQQLEQGKITQQQYDKYSQQIAQ